MRNLWREAGIAALVCGSLTACASPAYPIREDQPPGPAPLTMAKPSYPTSESASRPAPARAYQPAVADTDDNTPNAAPLSAPTAPVQSEPLPAPGPSASALDSARADGARLQYASLTSESAPVATQPAATGASAPTADAAATKPGPVSSSLPPATAPATTPASTAPTSAPASTPTSTAAQASDTTTAPPPAATQPVAPATAAAEPALTPQMVVHDQTAPTAPAAGRQPPPVREAVATPVPAARRGAAMIPTPADPHLAIAGDVVDASGGVFQNYEVQRGDHIDALARAFSTTRTILLDANNIRAPFVIHPGQIIKVPVAKAYVARSGDTLAGVARRFSVGVGELAQLNHISDRGALRPGQEIGLPSSMRDRGPQRMAETEYAMQSAPAPSYHVQAPPSHTMTPDPPTRHYAELPPAQTSPQPPRPTYGYQTSQPPGSTTQAAPTMSDGEIAQAAHGRFVWPLRGDMMARFGAQGVGRRNDGIDIRASQGTVVKAAASGEVVYAGNQVPGFGNLVLIKHSDGWVTAYAHLDQVNVQMKQQVAQGQALGSVGTSGGASEPELHFEVRYAPTPADKARPVDPVLVLPLG